MTRAEFRKIALSLPEAVESAHMGHPDFRVGGKIFATLDSPQTGYAMVALTPEEQEVFVLSKPTMFVPAKGGWGRSGSTNVILAKTDRQTARDALILAWRRKAPKGLAVPT
jgi:hypothetical protein